MQSKRAIHIMLIAFLAIFYMEANAQYEISDKETLEDAIPIDFAEAKDVKSIYDVLDNVYDEVCSYDKKKNQIKILDVPVGLVILRRIRLLIALALLISIAFKVIKVISNPKEEFDRWLFFKPALLMLFIFFYPQVMGIVNAGMELLTFRDYANKSLTITYLNQKWSTVDAISGGGFSSAEEYEQAIYDSRSITEEYYTEETSTIISAIQDEQVLEDLDFALKVKDARRKGKKLSQEDMQKVEQKVEEEYKRNLAIKTIKIIAFWISEKITLIMRIIQVILLCVLFIGGPIAIFMEVLFPGSLKKWMSIFIHTHLWTPVLFILDLTHAMLNKAFADYDDFGGTTTIIIVMQVVIIAMYLIIAKVASNFIQSQEGGGVLGAMSYKTAQHLGVLGKKGSGGLGGLTGLLSGTLRRGK